MLANFLGQLGFALSLTGPIFIVVILGFALVQLRLIDTQFMNAASRLVYLVALPALLFFSIVQTDIESILNGSLLVVASGATVLVFILYSLFASVCIKNKRERGVFVQGAFRGNLAIVGLALCSNAYGDEGLAIASILMSVMTLFFNVFSVYTLNASLTESGSVPFGKIVLGILKNPLIIAIVLALVINLVGLPIHSIALQTGDYLSQMTLPLALLCIGGTISLRELRSSKALASLAVIAKLVITPAITVWIAWLTGFTGVELGCLFLMASTPSAAAGFVMVQALGGNAALASNMVVISTLFSLFTISFGLALLQTLNIV